MHDISTQISGLEYQHSITGNIRDQFDNLEYDEELAEESGAVTIHSSGNDRTVQGRATIHDSGNDHDGSVATSHPIGNDRSVQGRATIHDGNNVRNGSSVATIHESGNDRIGSSSYTTIHRIGNECSVIRHATNYENGHDHEESSCTRYLLDSSEYDEELAVESGAVTARLRHPTRLATIASSEDGRQSMTVATSATDLRSRQSTKVATIAQVPRHTRTFHRSGDDRIAMDIRQTRKVATIALNQWRHSTRLATIAPSENGRQSMTEATIALNQ